jgi:hypothetical protein
MKQFILFNYIVEVNGRMARLVLEPGTPWDDAFQAIDTFKEEITKLREEAERREQESQDKSESLDVAA